MGCAEEESPQARTLKSEGSGEVLYGGMVSDPLPCDLLHLALLDEMNKDSKSQSCYLGIGKIMPVNVAHMYLKFLIFFFELYFN